MGKHHEARVVGKSKREEGMDRNEQSEKAEARVRASIGERSAERGREASQPLPLARSPMSGESRPYLILRLRLRMLVGGTMSALWLLVVMRLVHSIRRL